MQIEASERPLGELFGELARGTAVLLRQELELAKVETLAKAKLAGRSFALIAGGLVVATIGALALVAATIAALALVMPLWLACLAAGAVLAGGGGLVAAQGVSALRRLDPLPQHTIETLKENRQWLNEQISR